MAYDPSKPFDGKNLPNDVHAIDPMVAIARIEQAGITRFEAHTHAGGELQAHLIDIDNIDEFQVSLNPDGTWFAYGKRWPSGQSPVDPDDEVREGSA